jgi:hypothetical protein
MSALNRFLRPKKAAPVIDLSVADIGNLGDDTPHCDCPYEYNHEDNFSMHRHELRCDLAPDVDEWNWYPHDGELEDGGVGIPEHFRASLPGRTGESLPLKPDSRSELLHFFAHQAAQSLRVGTEISLI